jgi:outer membrane receptor protein involved in Fe transport
MALLLGIVVGLAAAIPALAQENSNATAAAPQEEPDEFMMEPVIVKGLRAERTEFETPTSLSVFTNQDLESIPQAQDVDDVLDRIPNIVDSGGGTSSQQVSIRGVDSTGSIIGGDAFSAGARPRVTLVVDGRPLSFNEYVFGDTSLYDIQQVEVYRGPQTTAQGANAIGGAVYVFTNDPTFEFEAGTLLEGAEQNRFRGAGHVSGPIIEDELAARVVVDYSREKSFSDFSDVSKIRPDVDLFEQYAVRGKLLWTPSALPELEAKLTISRTESQSPQDESVTEPFEDLNLLEPANIMEVQSTAGILDLEYVLSPTLRLSNQFTASDFLFQNFWVASFREDNVAVETDGYKLSNETILRFNPTERLSGLAGVYYTFVRQDDVAFLFFEEEVAEDKQHSLGLFTQATLNITDKLHLTAGVRYQRDTQDREGTIFLTPVDFEATFDAFLPKVELAYDISPGVRVGASASRGSNPGGVTVEFGTGEASEYDQETVWTYDVFARLLLLDNRLKLNANVFYSDYDDFQKNTFVGFGLLDNEINRVGNVPKAKSYGLEASADMKWLPNLSTFVSLGLLETELEENVPEGGTEDFEFARAPCVTLFSGVDYSPIENLTLSGQVRYTGGYFSDDDNFDETEVDSFVVADLSARYAWEKMEFFVYVENIADNFYETRLGFNPGGSGLTADIGQPRTVGGGIKVNF